jgi:protein ImuB
VDRLACVNVAALPLQILLRANPTWVSLPAAVVEDDRPHALVLHLNVFAYRAGVRSGQRYATALTLARDLRAGTVRPSQIAQEVDVLGDRLRRYTPHVEPSSEIPGVFWLDAGGLDRLYRSLQAWADGIRADLRGAGVQATVAVGFTRFGVYALAKSHRGTVMCTDAADERVKVQRVSLARLNLDPDDRDRLLALGIDTLGGFLGLPGAGIRARFGRTMEALYRLASGDRWSPLVPVPAEERYERSVDFDVPETNVDRLLFVVKRLLDGLASAIVRQSHTIVEVVVHLTLDDRSERVERVRPAAPTLDVAQFLTLVRLRLDARRAADGSRSGRVGFTGGIVAMRLTTETCPATPDQRRLFPEHGRRDLASAYEAFARLRAECGEHSVVRARLCDAHLPAARFAWEPIGPEARLPAHATVRVVASRPLVRRIFTRPILIVAGAEGAAGTEQCGPYVVSGGWWGGGVRRDYYYAHAASGGVRWLYYDHRRQCWFLQGCVE